ncbi:MAG: fatty acid desaturase [Pirellulales bacterium]
MDLKKTYWANAAVVFTIHAVALAAFLPWLFSWVGVAAAVLGLYFYGTLGINIGFHRLLTHRSFRCPPWLEHLLAIQGCCCLMHTPTKFVVYHRLHHRYSDGEQDPHSPRNSLFWGHVGWVICERSDVDWAGIYQQYGKDMVSDRFYRIFERGPWLIYLYALHALLFLAAGFLIGWISGGTTAAGWQMGLSLMVWGVFVRTVAVWHITWMVNSLAHTWGYRNYQTRDNSRNNWLAALLSNGDGWHNNHHAVPRAADHGQRWFELDVAFITIQLFEALGLAHDVVRSGGVRSAVAVAK